MSKVILVGAPGKQHVREAVAQAESWIRHEVEIVAVDLDESLVLEQASADYVFVFGGDGAILSTARRLGRNQIPVVGVNLGKLGFLAQLTPDELRAKLGEIVAGHCPVVERMRLECRAVRAGEEIGQALALNDLVLSRGTFSRVVSVNLFIDKEKVTTYNGDGLIVSTPVGSTAHSLSAGGPILSPEMEAFIVTGICTHSLASRPLVVPTSVELALEVAFAPIELAATFDGQVHLELQAGDVVTVRRAAHPLQLVETRTRTYFETLSDKLGWRGYPHYGKA